MSINSSNVTSLDDYRPHLAGVAQCTFCRDEWAFTIPIVAMDRVPMFECPTCHGTHGTIIEAEVVSE